MWGAKTGSHDQTGRWRPRPGAALPALLTLGALLMLSREALALSLLSIRDFSQSAGLSYAFRHFDASSQGAGSTEAEHEFTEDYGTSFSYSILSPLLLKGNAMLDLEWLQRSTDTGTSAQSASNFQLRYSITGLLLSRKPYPINFSASSARSTISQSFAPSYDSTTDNLMARLTILNDLVPAGIIVNQLTQETSGVRQNFRQDATTISLTAAPTLGKLGALSLSATSSDSTSTNLDSNISTDYATITARASYQKGWQSERGLSRSISFGYNYGGTAGTTPLINDNLNGNLSWQLGKALDGSLQYQRGSSRSPLFSSENQAIGLSMTHRLFSSLTTSLNLFASENRFNTGTDRSYSGSASLGYRKLLPEASSLSLGYSYGQSLNEREGNVSVVTVLNEEHPIPTTLPRRIALAHPTFDPATIRVVGAQTLLPYPASYFTTVPEGIELTNFFAGDTAVLVSYSYRQDPNVTTEAITHSATFLLTLFRDEYRLYTHARMTDQNLVKGDATLLTLTNTRHYDAGATAHLSRHTINGEAGYDKSYGQDLYYLTTSWAYGAPFAQGNLSLNANDRYTWQSLSQTGGQGGFWTNGFNMMTEYSRTIGPYAGRVKADYANVQIQGGAMSHTAVLGLNLEGRFGKLFALFYTNATWTFSDKGDSSSQGLGISVRRVF